MLYFLRIFFLLYVSCSLLGLLQESENLKDFLILGPSDQISEEVYRDFGLSRENCTPDQWKKKIIGKLQSVLIASLEIGDEKLVLVQTVQDIVENKARQLETDSKNLFFGRDEELQKEERVAKRPRRSRIESVFTALSSPCYESSSELTFSSTTVVTQSPIVDKNKKPHNVMSGKKTKKRKGRVNDRMNSPIDLPVDPDEPTYCLCEQVSFGEMIGCDNDLCPIEWFHFACVQLVTKPKGRWYCPKCRGDKPTIMKPKAQFLKELEKYNKEREEKA